MPQVIVIRLHPEEPMTGGDFTNHLTNLTIEAFDVSFTKPKVNVGTDVPIGQANGTRQIAQHWLPTRGFPPAAVATAVLEITSPLSRRDGQSPPGRACCQAKRRARSSSPKRQPARFERPLSSADSPHGNAYRALSSLKAPAQSIW